MGFDVAFSELRAEPFQQMDLFVSEFDPSLAHVVLKPQKTFDFGQKLMAAPDPSNATRADMDAL